MLMSLFLSFGREVKIAFYRLYRGGSREAHESATNDVVQVPYCSRLPMKRGPLERRAT